MTVKDRAFVVMPLGVTEAVVCNGLVRELLKKHAEVIVPTWIANAPLWAWMFADCLTNPSLGKIEGVTPMKMVTRQHMMLYADAHEHAKAPVYRLWETDAQKARTVKAWDRVMYEKAKVPFAARWDAFKIGSSPDKEVKTGEKKWLFVHDDAKRRFRIRDVELPRGIKIFRPEPQFAHIGAWRGIMAGAEGVHVMDGPFLALADSIPLQAMEFAFWDIRNDGSVPPTLLKDWRHMGAGGAC